MNNPKSLYTIFSLFLLLISSIIWINSDKKQININLTIYGILIASFMLGIDLAIYSHPLLAFNGRGFGGFHTPPAICIAVSSIAILPFIKHKITIWTISILILSILDCDSALLATIIGGIIAYLAKKYKNTKKIVTFTIIFSIFITPFVMNFGLRHIKHTTRSFSYVHRIYIWEDVIEKIKKRPLIGHGINASHKSSHEIKYFFNENNKKIAIDSTRYRHPHNISLQLWLELGLIGCIAFSIFIFYLSKIITIETLSTIFTIQYFTINLWDMWWLCFLSFLFGILASNFPTNNRTCNC